jgi:hypothetical protein
MLGSYVASIFIKKYIDFNIYLNTDLNKYLNINFNIVVNIF